MIWPLRLSSRKWELKLRWCLGNGDLWERCDPMWRRRWNGFEHILMIEISWCRDTIDCTVFRWVLRCSRNSTVAWAMHLSPGRFIRWKHHGLVIVHPIAWAAPTPPAYKNSCWCWKRQTSYDSLWLPSRYRNDGISEEKLSLAAVTLHDILYKGSRFVM